MRLTGTSWQCGNLQFRQDRGGVVYDHPNDFPPPGRGGPASPPQWGWSADRPPPTQPTAPYGYPTAPMAPPPPQQYAAPQRRRGAGVAVVVTIALLAAVLGFSGGLASGYVVWSGKATSAAAARSAASSPTPSASLPGPAAVAPGDGKALLAKVVPLPTGAKNVTVSGSTGGVMSLDQYVQKEYPNDSTERGRMQSRNFLVAASREWLDSAGVEVHVQLLQFGAADGAESSVLGQVNAYSNDSEVTGTFTLPVPHGSGYEKSKLDSAGNRRMVVMAQDGPVAVFIFFFTPKNFDRTAATALMQQQFAALA
jgi:hypothetical protein